MTLLDVAASSMVFGFAAAGGEQCYSHHLCQTCLLPVSISSRSCADAIWDDTELSCGVEWNGVAVHALGSIKVWGLSQSTSVTSFPHIVFCGGKYSPKCKLSSLLSTEVTLQTEILSSSSANPSVALQYHEQWFFKTLPQII